MKYFKIWGTVIGIVILSLFVKIDSWAVQYDFEPVEELPPGADGKDYIELLVDDVTYEVQKGDTLWGISRAFCGSGAEYMTVYEKNRDVITDADMIFPGQILRFPQNYYIPKDKYDRGGLVSQGGFYIALPDMVDDHYFMTEDMKTYVRPDGITTIYLPGINELGENALTKNWETFKDEVTRCSEEICEGRVSNLQFEKYQMKDVCDLCGYTFDFDAGSRNYEFAVFYRLGARNMAEVVGVREKRHNTELVDVTRYIAASFEDYGGKIGMGRTKTVDNVGAYEWNYPELHNLFVLAMDEYLEEEYAKRPEKNPEDDYELVWKEPRMEKAVRNALTILWHLDYEEKKAFFARPLTANDLSVITEVSCSLVDSTEDEDEDGSPMICIRCNGHKEEFCIDREGDFSYEDLANFKGAKKLVLSAPEIKDYSFVGEMTCLRELCIYTDAKVEDINFLSGLKELRTLQLLCRSHAKGEEGAAFMEIEDAGVLANCTELRYLWLEMPKLTDFSFLKKCPRVCTFILEGNPEGEEPAVPDLELLPKARFVEVYDEDLRWNP